jgi:membrane protein YdbS with pleckstrin-like domain
VTLRWDQTARQKLKRSASWLAALAIVFPFFLYAARHKNEGSFVYDLSVVLLYATFALVVCCTFSVTFFVAHLVDYGAVKQPSKVPSYKLPYRVEHSWVSRAFFLLTSPLAVLVLFWQVEEWRTDGVLGIVIMIPMCILMFVATVEQLLWRIDFHEDTIVRRSSLGVCTRIPYEKINVFDIHDDKVLIWLHDNSKVKVYSRGEQLEVIARIVEDRAREASRKAKSGWKRSRR